MSPRAAEGSVSRRLALFVLGLLVVAGFALRVDQFRFALPHVLYSDYIQVPQAAQFLRDGFFVERSSYPATHTWAYVVADLVTYGVDRVLGLGHWPDWNAFVRELQSEKLQHTIARAYTAGIGSLLALGVYLMARVRFPRGTALLAAAIAAVSPALVIYSHQARIHVPGITLLAFAAVPMLHLLLLPPAPRGAWKLALLTGLAIGIVASVFQLGFVLLLCCGLAMACLVRPWPRLLRDSAVILGGFALAFLALSNASRWPGIVGDAPGDSMLKDAATLGIPASFLRMGFAHHFPRFVSGFVLSEPVSAAAAVLFAWACWRGRHRWRDAIAFGSYPVVLLLLLGTNYENVRYSMSAVVFTAVFAAAGALSLRGRVPRAALAALLVVAPLASSVRFDLLLRRTDTRLAVDSLLCEMRGDNASIAVESALALDPSKLPKAVSEYPPRGDFKPWTTQGVPPRTTLSELHPSLFVRRRGEMGMGFLRDGVLEAMGFWRCAIVDTGATGSTCLPDAPQALCLDIWRARRPGPSIEFWARTPESATFMLRRARDNGLVAMAR